MKNIINKQDTEFINKSILRGSKWEEVEYFLDDKDIIEQFIDTENFALSNDSQGLIYPEYHYEIKRIMGTVMKNYTERDKIYTFYHTLNLCNLYPIHKKNYIYFKQAFSLLIPRIITEDCYCGGRTFNPTVSFVLFNVIDEKITNDDKFQNISFSDFQYISQFIRKCASYWEDESMIEKQQQFFKYLDNTVLIELLAKNLPLFFESKHFTFNKTLSGILIILLISQNKREKDILKSLNECKINNEAIGCLNLYYESFQKDETNKLLFDDFKKRFL